MNIFTRFGNWLESKRALRKHDLDDIALEFTSLRESVKENYERQGAASLELIRRLREDMEKIAVPQTVTKEMALTNIRLNRIELLVGLKRDPEAIKVPDTPRIG